MDNISTRRHGYIRRFAYLDSIGLKRMKDDLGLRIGISELKAVAEYFRKEETEDPTTDILYFIDRYIISRGNDPSQVMMPELTTDNKLIAETYADMMVKCREVGLTRNNAVTPALVSTAASEWMSHVNTGKVLPSFVSEAIFSASYDNCLNEAARGLSLTQRFFAGDNNEPSVSLYKRRNLPVYNGDLIFILLCPRKGLDEEDFSSVVYQLITDSYISGSVICSYHVGDGGIPYALANMCAGCTVRAERLPLYDGNNYDYFNIDGLCDMYRGYEIIGIPSCMLNNVGYFLDSNGFIFYVFANSDHTGRFKATPHRKVLRGRSQSSIIIKA